MRIRCEFPRGDWPWARQLAVADLPLDIEFDFSFAPTGIYDALVVFESLATTRTICVPPQRTLFITGEPTPVKKYDRGFLRQFHRVVTTQASLREALGNERFMLDNTALPWFIGVDLDTRREAFPLVKCMDLSLARKRQLSVVCSRKVATPGHRQRLAFVDALKNRMGEQFHVFGQGQRRIADKAEAILPYQFHLVIENCVESHYWTEKLADAILGGSIVFYHGCPNIGDYFSSKSIIAIDINDPYAPDHIVTTIKDMRCEEVTTSVAENRHVLLTKYNYFAKIPAWLKDLPVSAPQPCRFIPEPNGILRRLRRVVGI